MPGWDKYSARSAQNGFNASSNPPAGNYKTSVNFKNTYTCCIPLISGVLDSMLAYHACCSGNPCTFKFVCTASAQKAFQLSMDPCRRALGTVREYLSFGGSMGGLFGQIHLLEYPLKVI